MNVFSLKNDRFGPDEDGWMGRAVRGRETAGCVPKKRILCEVFLGVVEFFPLVFSGHLMFLYSEAINLCWVH